MSDDTRASDDDRNAICQVLDAALGDGQLSTEEHRERVAAATRATTLRELRSLVTDLQIRPASEQPPASRAPIGRRGAWIAVACALVLLGAGLAWGLPRDTPSAPTAPIKGGGRQARPPSRQKEESRPLSTSFPKRAPLAAAMVSGR